MSVELIGDFRDHHTGLRGECSTQKVTSRIITQVLRVRQLRKLHHNYDSETTVG